MRVIYNKYFPFKPFLATNIFGVILCRGKKGRLSDVDINHEYIHTLQQRELFFIGFMLLYYFEWLYWLCKLRGFMKAYYAISFEREAYRNEKNLKYSKTRKRFAWFKILRETSPIVHESYNFFKDIANFIKDDFRLSKYLYVALLAVTIVIGQVYFNIYDIIIAPSYKDGTSMLRLPLVYSTAYFLVLIPTLYMHGEIHRLKQWQAWIFPLILVSIDGAGQGFDAYRQWINNAEMYNKERFYLKLVSSFFFRSIAIVFSLCCFRWLTTGKFGLFGLKRSGKYLKTYGLIYCLLVPIFVAISFTPQFLNFYPKMNIEYCHGCFDWADWKIISLFELCYANDFIGVEGMFRGALVIGMTKWLGPRAVLPMAITYMCIHLGKPDLELCSSIFGGYILGILAYRTQHLWGGIIIHLGIAMLFEALGLFRFYL
ncbi:MAG: CPBP family intramembrane metalloprotease [Bacteroidaceae bacterium]|nr:CPBP family intramembrane metalloprotease [Bacteroidaceae bacterium]